MALLAATSHLLSLPGPVGQVLAWALFLVLLLAAAPALALLLPRKRRKKVAG